MRPTIRVFAILAAFLSAYGQPSGKVDVTTTQLAPNLYRLEICGTAVAALTGPNGVFLVDSGCHGADMNNIRAAIAAISSEPIRFLVNTTARADHAGGNESFAHLGATIFGRPQLRERLAHPVFSANGVPGSEWPDPAPASALPIVTFDAPVTFHLNGEEIQVVPLPRAYTDGDSLVRFVNADVIMTGEIFSSVSYPDIDRPNGGTVQGLLDGLTAVLAMAGPNTRIVPGFDRIANRAAVLAQRDMILVLRDRVAALVRQGKSKLEVAEAHVTADYPAGRKGRDRIIWDLYDEMTSVVPTR